MTETTTNICPITKSEIVEESVTTCGHKFEKEALIEWLKTKSTCPICRHVIGEKDEDDEMIFIDENVTLEQLESMAAQLFRDIQVRVEIGGRAFPFTSRALNLETLTLEQLESTTASLLSDIPSSSQTRREKNKRNRPPLRPRRRN